MNLENILEQVFTPKIMESIIVAVVLFAVYFILKRIVDKVLLKTNKINIKAKNKREKKKNTYLKIVKSSLKYIYLLLILFIILQINGVNVSSIIAGVGVVSVIIGLALQDALKDIIMGVNVLVDDYFSLGDIVKLDDIEGKVVEIGIKNIKIRDIYTDNLFVISNRNISKAIVIADRFDIDIPLPYEENALEMEKILKEIIDTVKINEKIKEIKYVGINEFADSAIYYKLRVWSSAETKPQIKRDILKVIKLKLDEHKVDIPYTQIDVHTKK